MVNELQDKWNDLHIQNAMKLWNAVIALCCMVLTILVFIIYLQYINVNQVKRIDELEDRIELYRHLQKEAEKK